jgi:hypothetical protein
MVYYSRNASLIGTGIISQQTGVFDTVFSQVTTGADLFPFTTATFTNCSASGIYGPISSQCQAVYGSEDWYNDYFSVPTTGTQEWTVPKTAIYTLVMQGASGGNGYIGGSSSNRGGYGYKMTCTISLDKGTVLSMRIGQMGQDSSGSCANAGGGGGGATWVVNKTDNNSLLFALGGGGGGGVGSSSTQDANSGNGGQNANGAQGTATVLGGTSGGGGESASYSADGCVSGGAGGGGWSSNGQAYSSGQNSSHTGAVGLSWANGSTGGSNSHRYGGFGGGAASGYYCGSGGGGYSGGAGGGVAGSCVCANIVNGGGGGTYRIATSSLVSGSLHNAAAHGYVTITL